MKHPQKGLFARLLGKSETPIIVFTLLVYGAFSVMAPNFNTFNNVSVIAQQITINGIVALGMTIVIMIGGMDLSVGSLLSLCGVLAGMMDNAGLPVSLTVLLTLALGTALGALNGLLIVKLHIPDIIVTLATMNIFRGVAVMITRSQWITDFSEGFLRIGASKGGLFSIPILLYAAVAVVFAVCLRWPDTRGLTILPAGDYLCANCCEADRQACTAQLQAQAQQRGGRPPAFVVEQVVVTGILQWSYQVQVPLPAWLDNKVQA